jgi:hypothetical protein
MKANFKPREVECFSYRGGDDPEFQAWLLSIGHSYMTNKYSGGGVSIELPNGSIESFGSDRDWGIISWFVWDGEKLKGYTDEKFHQTFDVPRDISGEPKQPYQVKEYGAKWWKDTLREMRRRV